MLLHYLGKLKLQFFADIQQIWKKLQTNRYISVFKIATLSPYWLQINAPCHCSLTYLLLQSISGSRCYQSCAVLLVTCTCSSRIVPQLTALVTLSSYCSRRLQFIAPDLRLPNDSDVNPVDYHVWGLMQERVYKTVVRDTADLKQGLILCAQIIHRQRECWLIMHYKVSKHSADLQINVPMSAYFYLSHVHS